ncbi:RNA polymerase I subunit RpI12 isoform X2 [Haematobia irritans]|uniref:RNA polymerase I subunit RpI12 isoform X2 n=1 Tax=Haematobia irritans TaxID=7368 RepID=UPI003F50B185
MCSVIIVNKPINPMVIIFGDQIVEYTIHFNNYDPSKLVKTKEEQDSSAEGPVVERKCPKCGNDKMSYATLQLRSADEGQTVFFTCLKCKFKESENS